MIYALLNGVNFRPQEARALVAGLEEGEELVLVREPGNAYDTNAIKVLHPENEIHLGYIEKDIAAELAPRMDDGEEFTCEMYSREGTIKVRLAIDREDGEEEDEALDEDDEQSIE